MSAPFDPTKAVLCLVRVSASDPCVAVRTGLSSVDEAVETLSSSISSRSTKLWVLLNSDMMMVYYFWGYCEVMWVIRSDEEENRKLDAGLCLYPLLDRST